MLTDLEHEFGRRGACAVLGVPIMSFKAWRYAGQRPSYGTARAVWLTDTLLFRPDLLQSAFDLVTWERFHVGRRLVRRPAGEWSDWSI